MSHIITTPGTAGTDGMAEVLSQSLPAARRRADVGQRGDLWQYRSMLAFAVVCFFVYACLARLLRRCAHPLARPAPESVFAEARRQACTAVPHAFMR